MLFTLMWESFICRAHLDWFFCSNTQENTEWRIFGIIIATWIVECFVIGFPMFEGVKFPCQPEKLLFKELGIVSLLPTPSLLLNRNIDTIQSFKPEKTRTYIVACLYNEEFKEMTTLFKSFITICRQYHDSYDLLSDETYIPWIFFDGAYNNSKYQKTAERLEEVLQKLGLIKIEENWKYGKKWIVHVLPKAQPITVFLKDNVKVFIYLIHCLPIQDSEN